MRQYRPARADDWDWLGERPMLEGKTVFECNDWRDSGLLDASGTKLIVRDVIGPIGFVWPREA